MEYRTFGSTGFQVSLIGFGAWGIGGPAMAGPTPIGWGDVNDQVSENAIRAALDRGVTFFDTADFYGLGHSEELLGRVLGNRPEVVLATKVGHRLQDEGSITLDYSRDYILQACEASLRRLQRECIDHYQLHSARLPHLERGECLEALERLREAGKIRSWGLSLNTFEPEPEATYLMERALGDGFQLVLNVLNQRSLPLLRRAAEQGYGIIARMPLQFGLLSGKFTPLTTFKENDHRSFRLTRKILTESLDALREIWPLAERVKLSKTAFSLSYVASYPQISTIIPGIKTPEQARENTTDIRRLDDADRQAVESLYQKRFAAIVEMMQRQG
jgi:aryl-alcohol dehydrogenase-like predicted oxidoreductase